MHVWMNVMRAIEPIVANHGAILPAWHDGGCRGLVIGPPLFNQPRLGKNIEVLPRGEPLTAAYKPNLALYDRLDVPRPTLPAPESSRYASLTRTLLAAKDLGWKVWIFQPQVGMSSTGAGHGILSSDVHRAVAARTVDTIEHFPMIDGVIFDGPEWGYEITPGYRSYLFDDLPESVEQHCSEIGYRYDDLVAARERVWELLHSLKSSEVDADEFPRRMEPWSAFRRETLTRYFRNVSELVRSECTVPMEVACGTRTAAFADLCGYDFAELSACMDVILPKFYVWHRGFDGFVGTIGRYLQVLSRWNPGLSDAAIIPLLENLSDVPLPGVNSYADLDRILVSPFIADLVNGEARRVLDAVDGAAEVAPWVDAGRFPHDGDPLSAPNLHDILSTSAEAGIGAFVYHHTENLTAGEWSVMSGLCGNSWDPRTSAFEPDDRLVL